MPEARAWILDRKVTDDLVGPGLTHEVRAWLDRAAAPTGWRSSSSAASPGATSPTTSPGRS